MVRRKKLMTVSAVNVCMWACVVTGQESIDHGSAEHAPTATELSVAAPAEASRAVSSEFSTYDRPKETTPEMWFYMQQLRRHDDPALKVRRRAEQSATQRRQRLAAMKWYGLSNARPTASPIPTYGVYSPAWAGHPWQPFIWSGAGLGYRGY